jgi:hypothetical protein
MKTKLKFYVCNKCGQLHFLPWDGGDCKEHFRSADKAELDKAYGPKGWEVVADPYTVAK